MNNRMLLLWLATGAGVILLYAAIKDKSPTSVLTGYAKGGTDTGNDTALPNQPTIPVPGGPVQAQFTTDANGFTHDVPPTYAGNPDLFVPPTG